MAALAWMGKLNVLSKNTVSTATYLFEAIHTVTTSMRVDLKAVAPIPASDTDTQDFIFLSSP